jgi:hypothetical protein
LLSQDIYFLKGYDTVIVKLLPNTNNHYPFVLKEINNSFYGKRPYCFALINNKYTVFYTGIRIHKFILENMINNHINPFDLKIDIALKIEFRKLRQLLNIGSSSLNYKTELTYIHDKRYMCNIEKIEKICKNFNLEKTIDCFYNRKNIFNNPLEFFDKNL